MKRYYLKYFFETPLDANLNLDQTITALNALLIGLSQIWAPKMPTSPSSTGLSKYGLICWFLRKFEISPV